MAGRTALVTGSVAGLGLAMARALAGAGARVVLHGIEPPEQAASARDELAALTGEDVLYVRADLAHRAEVERLVAQAQARLGPIDVLINNAVTRHFAPVHEFPVEAWDRALAVNVSAAFDAIRLCLPDMRRRGWGRIFNFTSVYGSRAVANRIDYVTSKTALIGLTRAVALEGVNHGITCNALCPGSVLTPANEARIAALMDDSGLPRDAAVERFLAGKQPAGRFVEAEHVAELMLFLCGEAGRDITGAVLPVEGGWLAG